MKKRALAILTMVLTGFNVYAQNVVWPAENIKLLTSEWTGERLPDGRPKVSDDLLERLKSLSMEEVWSTLRSEGYENQFENFASIYENGWEIIHPEKVMTGRVVTAQFMPLRKDFDKYVQAQAEKEGTKTPVTNYAPIIKLTDGDVYVADSYGKIENGTLIGDNLANAIYNKGKRGIIFNGSVRDVEGLSEIEGFNGWIRGTDPSAIGQMMCATVNAPIRIGRVTVLPGDVVLAKKYGVIFIPAQLVEDLVITSEVTALRDEFGHLRLREGKYKPGQIDSQWSDEIKKDFMNWLNNYPGKLPMTKAELDNYFKDRNW